MLEDAALADFERRAVEHLHRTLPAQCAALGRPAVRDSVRDAIAKARGYGIKSEADVLSYLNLMYLLGFDFESQPRFAWANELLQATDVQAASRLTLLRNRAMREIFP